MLVSVSALAAFLYSLMATPAYRSDAVLRLNSTAVRVFFPEEISGQRSDQPSAAIFVDLVNEPSFKEEILGSKALAPSEASDDVWSELVGTGGLFRISASASTPERSKEISNAALERLVAQSEKLTSGLEPVKRGIERTFVMPLRGKIGELNAQVEIMRNTRRSLWPATEKGGTADIDARIAKTLWQARDAERRYYAYSDYLAQLTLRQSIARQDLILVSEPIAPKSPRDSNLMSNAVIGGLVGLLLGVSLAAFAEARTAGRSERVAWETT